MISVNMAVKFYSADLTGTLGKADLSLHKR